MEITDEKLYNWGFVPSEGRYWRNLYKGTPSRLKIYTGANLSWNENEGVYLELFEENRLLDRIHLHHIQDAEALEKLIKLLTKPTGKKKASLDSI